MKAAAVSEKDLEYLRSQTSNVMRFGICILMPLGSLIATVTGLLNLSHCSRYAALAGMSMMEVIQNWFDGIDISAQYSGMQIKALERWELAIFELAVAGIVAGMCVIGWQSMKRSARILKFIEEKNKEIGQ